MVTPSVAPRPVALKLREPLRRLNSLFATMLDPFRVSVPPRPPPLARAGAPVVSKTMLPSATIELFSPRPSMTKGVVARKSPWVVTPPEPVITIPPGAFASSS